MTRIVTRPVAPADAEVLARHGLHPVLARSVRVARRAVPADIETALARLVPPTELKGCADAASLLADAIADKRRLLVVADYD